MRDCTLPVSPVLICLVVAGLIVSGPVTVSQSISASGGWDLLLGEGNLVGPPGSDFPSEFESASGATTISVSDAFSIGWSVTVWRTAEDWPEGVRLFVRRTSSGNFNGDLNGGTAYQEVLAGETYFFDGSGNGSGVAIQYRLTGTSVEAGAALHESSVIFRITEGDVE